MIAPIQRFVSRSFDGKGTRLVVAVRKREFTIERRRRQDAPATKPIAVSVPHGEPAAEPSTLDVLSAITDFAARALHAARGVAAADDR